MAKDKNNLLIVIAIVAIVAIFALVLRSQNAAQNIGGEAATIGTRTMTVPRGTLSPLDGQKFCCETKCAGQWPTNAWQSCAKSCMGSLCTMGQVTTAWSVNSSMQNSYTNPGLSSEGASDLGKTTSRTCNCWKGSTLTTITCDWSSTCQSCCGDQGGSSTGLPQDCLPSSSACGGSQGKSCCSGNCYAGICA